MWGPKKCDKKYKLKDIKLLMHQSTSPKQNKTNKTVNRTNLKRLKGLSTKPQTVIKLIISNYKVYKKRQEKTERRKRP